MSWTHPQCKECWHIEHPTIKVEPTRVVEPIKPYICCTCGKPTTDGIFIRRDPELVNYLNNKDN